MKQYNCKNCGAPIEHSYNHKCPYCGSIFDFNAPIETIVEVRPEDLVDVELRDMSINPETGNMILMFSGYKCVMPKVYEYNGNNTYISSVENYINPPKCGFLIEIPVSDLERGIDYIMWVVKNTGIRYNELDKVARQIVGKIGRNWRYCNEN